MFVQFVLEQIWSVYAAVMLQPDEQRALKIVGALKLSVTEREVKNSNRDEALRCIMSRWLPLAQSLLGMVVEQMPSPVTAQADRMHRLLPQTPQSAPSRCTSVQKLPAANVAEIRLDIHIPLRR